MVTRHAPGFVAGPKNARSGFTFVVPKMTADTVVVGCGQWRDDAHHSFDRSGGCRAPSGFHWVGLGGSKLILPR